MLKIEKLVEKADVYDITVEDNENFFANGILVHNCNEIVEYSDEKETAVCNLASLALPKFVKEKADGTPEYDFAKLYSVSKIAIKNLNNVIDVNFYPTEKTERSNLRHRPVALGVQGLADVYMKMGLPFESMGAMELNREIFETIYMASIESSMEEAKEHGAYETFKGSPISEGQFQFDLWGVEPKHKEKWEKLRKQVMEHGVRNSLVTALMPTASTGSILGNTECFQPQTANIFKRQVLSGEYILINKHLVKDLEKLGLWDKTMSDKIVLGDGSIQDIPEIPDELKAVYKTVWEVSQKNVIDQSAARGAFVDQTQSMNLFLPKSDNMFSKLMSAHMYGWEKGLKTGQYYLRSRAAIDAVKMTVSDNKVETLRGHNNPPEEDCESCSA